MRGGQLRDRVTFQRSTFTQNSHGEAIPTWNDVGCEVWARVEPLAGKERYAAMQTQADTDYRVVIRYQSAFADLTPADRLMWGSVAFDIKAIINTDSRNRELQVFVKRHI